MSSQVTAQIVATVAANVKGAREAAGLTQRQLAQRLDMDPMNVSRWERAVVMPSTTNLAALAAELKREPSWFYIDHAQKAAA